MRGTVTIAIILVLLAYCARLKWKLWVTEKMLKLEETSTAALRWRLWQAKVRETREEEWPEVING